MVITGAASFQSSDFWGKFKRSCVDIDIQLTQEICPAEPSPRLVDDIKQKYQNKVVDVVVGIGGGSALDAAKALRKDGVKAEVINCATVKPLDEKTILRSARKTGRVVTAEEHQVTGGLGGAVAELLSTREPVPVRRVGVHDTFGESGNWETLLEKYGLTVDAIIAAAKELL